MPTMDLDVSKYNCDDCEKKIKEDNVYGHPLCNACKGYKSMMLKSVSYSDEKIRNIFIRISLLCNETDIGSFVNVFEDLQ